MTVIHNAREDRRHKRLNVDIPGTDPSHYASWPT
jgi:hypothetical protein